MAEQCRPDFRPRIAACKERLRAGEAAGPLLPDIDLDIAIDLFYGGFYHRYVLGVTPLGDEHADAIVDAALAGIGPRKTGKLVGTARRRPR